MGCQLEQLDAGISPAPLPASPKAAPVQAQADPFIKKDAAVPVDDKAPVANSILTVEVYNLSQTEGARLIEENGTDEARHACVRNLVQEGKARLDAVLCRAVAYGKQT